MGESRVLSAMGKVLIELSLSKTLVLHTAAHQLTETGSMLIIFGLPVRWQIFLPLEFQQLWALKEIIEL